MISPGPGHRPSDTIVRPTIRPERWDGRDAMQSALDAGAVVVADWPTLFRDVLEVGRGNRMVRQEHLNGRDARFRLAP